MSTLKDSLQSALTEAIRARDEVTSATLRMALTAITNEEVSGSKARELSDEQVITVLSREGKKRREAAEAYDAAGRPELAARERAELVVLERYLPQQLTADEIDAIVTAAVASVADQGLAGGKAMGAVMKVVTPQVAGRADGAAVAAQVKAALGLG
jgi:uncharacterized protein YqeY